MNELILKINRKDVRSGIRWCNKNNVEIYEDSRGQFIIESEFNYVYNLPVIKKYKEKYKDNWEIMYELAKNNELYKAESTLSENSQHERYKSQSKISNEFFKDY